MGADTFKQGGKGKTVEAAFKAARDQALYDYGHRGYTGSLAEKRSYVLIEVPAGSDANEFVDRLIEKGDPRIDDKWGPAGAVKVGKEEYLFFGWASS